MPPSTHPHQPRLFKAETFPRPRVAARVRDANAEAARRILEDPAKHGGEDALAVRWARAVAGEKGE